MTTTLLKHEWLRTRGMLGTAFGVILLVGILGSLLGALGLSALSMIGLFLGVMAAAILIPVVQVLLAVDYWRSGYGRTGYFTQSIPVRGSTIFWAKLLWSLIVSGVAVAVTALLGWLAWWAVAVNADFTRPTPHVIGDAVESLLDLAPAWMVVLGVLAVLASLASTMVYYFFSVSIGHERWLGNMGAGGPIVVFVVLYVVSQVASFIGMLVIPLGLGMKDDRLGVVPFYVLSEMSMGTGSSDVMPIGFLVTLLLLVAVLLWRTVLSWNHKVALR